MSHWFDFISVSAGLKVAVPLALMALSCFLMIKAFGMKLPKEKR